LSGGAPVNDVVSYDDHGGRCVRGDHKRTLSLVVVAELVGAGLVVVVGGTAS